MWRDLSTSRFSIRQVFLGNDRRIRSSSTDTSHFSLLFSIISDTLRSSSIYFHNFVLQMNFQRVRLVAAPNSNIQIMIPSQNIRSLMPRMPYLHRLNTTGCTQTSGFMPLSTSSQIPFISCSSATVNSSASTVASSEPLTTPSEELMSISKRSMEPIPSHLNETCTFRSTIDVMYAEKSMCAIFFKTKINEFSQRPMIL